MMAKIIARTNARRDHKIENILYSQAELTSLKNKKKKNTGLR